MEKGGNNRHLMLWIDPTARSASIMIGYGLEPLIDPETHLLPCLQTGAQALAAGQIGKAAAAMIAQLQSRLDTLAGQLPTAFGWMPDDLWQSMDDDEGLLTLHLEQRHLLNY